MDYLWYKDGIIYQTHVKAFLDTNDDGVGDFQGLTRKLDYLQDLGVNILWLLPFYPSPPRDDGYEIANYTAVNPAYGTLGDFKAFLRDAHRRGLRVVTELVINHTSDQHAWFQKSRRAKPGSLWRDFYVWNDSPEKYTDARIIFKDYETSNWAWDPVAKAYYWHRFFSHQPDLNFDNPAVHDALFKAFEFWMNLGVDAFRLDAIPYLYEREGTICENLPETHVYLKKLRARLDAKYPGRMLLAEANQWPEDSLPYYGDEIGMGDNIYLGDRNGVRTPMQWSADRNAGFSKANPQKLYLPVIIDPQYHYEQVNVDAQQSNPHSLLWWMKRLIAQRKRYRAFGRGTMEFVHTENRKILAFVRRYEEETILVIANLSRYVQCCELDLAQYKGMVPVELSGSTRFPEIGERPYFVNIGPFTFYWFTLERQRPEVALSEDVP